jgi:hypothetical protein
VQNSYFGKAILVLRSLPAGIDTTQILVRTDNTRGAEPVADCDRFAEERQPALSALRLHRAWRDHGLHRGLKLVRV